MKRPTARFGLAAGLALLLAGVAGAHDGHDGRCGAGQAAAGAGCVPCDATECGESDGARRVRVEISRGDPVRGPSGAPVTIVQYSDFQCPYCARGAATMRRIEEAFGDQVRIVFKDFPLEFHRHAQIAAEAGRCAGEQGAFWEFHDKLFSNQRALGREALRVYAAELDLEMGQFDSCLESRTYADEILAGKEEGRALGITGTPAYVINGRLMGGARPFEVFESVIRQELAAAGR